MAIAIHLAMSKEISLFYALSWFLPSHLLRSQRTGGLRNNDQSKNDQKINDPKVNHQENTFDCEVFFKVPQSEIWINERIDLALRALEAELGAVQLQKIYQNAQRQMEQASDRGYFPVCIADPSYPAALLQFEFPPPVLMVKGHKVWQNLKLLSAVGTRNPSSLSKEFVDNVLYDYLCQTHWGMVSGGARGVDQLVHLCSLRASTPTVVFLPSGCLQPYPQKFILEYEKEICEGGGAIVSQFSPAMLMKKFHFLLRNQLIAMVSTGTIVIESQRRGGTMMTAQYAADFGKPVLVPPFHPSQGSGLGNLDLIRSGAEMVCDVEDLHNLL